MEVSQDRPGQWVEKQPTRATLNKNAPPPFAPHSPTRRVLAADDNPAVRDLLTRILSVSGYAVETVPDGLAAIGRLRTAAFDLLITDLQMSGLGGIELAGDAKQLCPEIKILIVTGYPSQSSAIEAVNLGVDGYLTKPIGAVDLLLAIARIVAPGAEVEGSMDNRTEIRPPHAQL